MPVLSNAKHELYCQNRLEGQTIHEAYKNAGYKPNRGNAARLNANESIKARIRELQRKAADLVEKSLADCLAELENVAFSNITDFLSIDEDGQLDLDYSKVEGTKVAALKEFAIEDKKAGRGKTSRVIRRVRLRLHDKIKALVELTELKIAAEQVQTASGDEPLGQDTSEAETDHLVELAQRYRLRLKK